MSVRTVQLKVNETGEVFSDKLCAYTLELPDYRNMREEDCKTKIDYWLYNLTNMETMTQNIPFQAEQPIFSKVGNIGELIHMTAEERTKYNISIDSYRTNLSVMKKEREEGRKEEKMANAANLKKLGVANEVIAEALGLAVDEIDKL